MPRPGDEEAEYDAKKRLRELLRQRDENFTDAMRLTAQYYRLNPVKIETAVVKPDDPAGHWAAGIPVKWDPVFIDKKEDYVRVEANAPGKPMKEHFLGSNIDLAVIGGGRGNQGAAGFPAGRT